MISERAGVSVGSLYRYFDDKREILLQLLIQLAPELIASWAEEAPSAGSESELTIDPTLVIAVLQYL